MIASKFCDVCDTEYPPVAFLDGYECADVELHPNHPDKNHSWVRITANPQFTNGDSYKRVDICPDCFLLLCERLTERLRRRNRRTKAALQKWKDLRVVSRKHEILRGESLKQEIRP